MKKHRQVTEEDLLVTEALISKSYGQLKQSVIQAPSHVYRSISQAAREHPYETAAAGIVAGVAVCGIVKMKSSGAAVPEAHERVRVTIERDSSRQDLMQEMVKIMIPMLTPYIAGYIQKYIGGIPSAEHE
jgi:hypothetical protein